MMHGTKPSSAPVQKNYHEREPPPYPGNNTQNWFDPGLRQSYSGSEASTDFSLSSTESLSTRQEPQGQETASLVSTPIDSLNGENPFSAELIPPLTAGFENLKTSAALFAMGGGGLNPAAPTGELSVPEVQRGSRGSSPHSRTPPPYNHHHQRKAMQQQQEQLQVPQKVSPSLSPETSFKGQPPGSLPAQEMKKLSPQQLQQLLQLTEQQRLQSQGSIRSTKSASPTPPDRTKPRSLQRPSTAPAQRPAPLPLPPPTHELHGRAMRQSSLPEETKKTKTLRRSFEMLDKLPQTHSQPDLTRYRNEVMVATNREILNPQVQPPQVMQQQLMLMQGQIQHQSKKKLPVTELDHAAIATRATQMVERLSQENLALRNELHVYYKKVCRLQKLENEIDKVHQAYETLVKHSQKKETLEKAMRMKLESDVQSLTLNNQKLREQLDKAMQHINNEEKFVNNESDFKRELQRKDNMLNQVIAQNHDILLAKERLQAEVANQKTSLDEQRTTIVALDNALTHAQNTVKEDTNEGTVANLQKAISLLQGANQTEEEKQIAEKPQNGQNRSSDTDEGIASDTESPTSVPNLMQHLQQREQRILVLEAQIHNLEQKYIEETTLRQLAVDMASMPNDARIAALEQSSLSSEKLLENSRTEKLRHLEELYQTNRRLAEAEAEISSLQAQLAKKDAMIKVLKHKPALDYARLLSPLHTPHHSLLSPSPSILHSPVPSTSYSTAFESPQASFFRQNSQVDSHSLPALSTANSSQVTHNKSNSVGSASVAGGSENQWIEAQQKLAAQAALIESLQTGSDQLKKCFWQV